MNGKSDDIIYFQTPDPETGLRGAITKAENVAHVKLSTQNNGTAILYLIVESLEDTMKVSVVWEAVPVEYEG